MKWYRFFKSTDDGKTVTLDPSVTGGFVFPNISITTNSSVGTKVIGAAKSVTATGTYVPVQCYLSVAADGGSTVGAGYFKVVTGAAMTGQIATLMVRTGIYHNVFDAYGLMSHIVFDSATVQTTDANAHLTAISGKVTFAGGTVHHGWVTAGLFIVEGAGTCSQMCHGVSIVNEAGSTGALSLLHLNDDVGTVPYISFAGADGTGKGIYLHTSGAGVSQEGTIKVLINGVAKWIPLVAAE